MNRDEDDYFGAKANTEKIDSDAGGSETIPSGLGDGFGILTSLPLGTTTSTKSKRNEKIGDDELEELVRRKQWEIKLAKKIEKKRRRIEKKAKKEAKKLKKAAANDSAGIAKKKKTKIDAFGGLVGLTYDSDDESDDKKVPKKNAVIVEEGSDESDVGSNDFFGLRSTSEVPQPPIDHVLPTVMSDISYGPTRPPIRLNQDPAFDYTNASVEILPSKAEGPSTSGIIDNVEAQRMIYSHDVATWGGTEASAAAAVDSIVDVSVDQALGPNVQANLLKNLHNKSLAEATLSHLAAVPKAKKPADMIARRKHQITYLATVAVAREEQLAEQWSQNRHMKRVSAQKYGF
ncbi:unnamed protein product [Toxocara canis]|uniref:Proline-rich protein PRCC n=1 Tax=Toxocara canis TaxID=6265 RepID=A0A183V1H6_TOXCA|nr:unnamed protein product [Toxocara canis]